MKKIISHLVVGILMISMFFCLVSIPSGQAEPLYNPLPNLDASKNDEIIVKFVASVLEVAYKVVIGLALLFIILGGVLYMLSAGNEDRMNTARKMIIYAIIGLAITVGAAVILKELATAFGGSTTFANFSGASQYTSGLPDAMAILTNVINLLLACLGILGIIGIVIGGFWYLTAGGDEKKAEIGKKTLVYAIIGLAIAIGSLIIVKQIEKLFTTT